MSHTAPIRSICSSVALLLLFLLFSVSTSYGEMIDQESDTVTIQISSLFPASASCKPSTTPTGTVNEKNGVIETKVKLVHKHGPCNTDGPLSPINMTQIAAHDEARVRSILSRKRQNQTKLDSASTSILARDGSLVNSGNYIVSVGLGTPKTQVSLIFDTGSDLTWTQCQPCARFCHKQVGPIFDPSKSKTYSNVSCRASLCAQLRSTTGTPPGCTSGTCTYLIQYGDQSFSVGYLSKDKLTLSSSAGGHVDGFFFGCGQNNRGLFGGSGGLLGLGRDKVSFVSQTAGKFGKVFSYCLPSSPSTTGHLTFGQSHDVSRKYAFTKLKIHSEYSSFYFLEMTGISVGGFKLPIPTSTFAFGGTLIDSGTVITRLQPSAYAALRARFRQLMKRYPSATSLSILDTCYDFTGYSSVSIPKLAFEFSGGAVVDVDPAGILIPASISQVCLAVAPNQDDSDIGIFGNMQQLTYNVVYDVAGGRLGFGSHGCN